MQHTWNLKDDFKVPQHANVHFTNSRKPEWSKCKHSTQAEGDDQQTAMPVLPTVPDGLLSLPVGV
jgi:hypothetical protein